MNPAVKINNLSVTLGRQTRALNGVSLELPADKTVGFIGPSGAGKTTLIRAIVGRLQVPEGSVMIFDKPAGAAALRKSLTYMTQELSVYADLTVEENLMYFARMNGQSRSRARNTVHEVLTTVDLLPRAGQLVSDLSGGQKQRVSLGVALIGEPKLMVLDEPTVGLDPILRDKLWHLFKRLAESGTTLIISSHSMDEAARCDDLVLIREGEVIAHSEPAELLKNTHSHSIEQAFLKLVGDKA